MSNRTAADCLTQDPNFAPLKDFLIEHTGLAYYSRKDDDLAQRIQRRLSDLNLTDCGTYLNLLKNGRDGEQELDALITELTIGETYFFRNQEQFEALRHVVFPEIFKRNRRKKRLRIWSAGCATGAEPYSLSIMLKREFPHLLAGWQVSILGTDVNRKFLALATEGIFQEWAFRATPEELKSGCFSRSDKAYRIKPLFKEWVSFQYHNLVKHPFPSLVNNLAGFDLILCRNVMIYFEQQLISRLIKQLHRTLVEGGWLLVGHADSNVRHFRRFRMLSVHRTTVYLKDSSPASAEENSFGLSPSEINIPKIIPDSPIPQPELDFTFEPVTEVKADWDQHDTLVTTVTKPTPEKESPEEVHEHKAPPDRLTAIRNLTNTGEYEKAAALCRQLIEQDKLNPTPYFYYALVLDQMGQEPETEQSLRKAIYLDRSFVFGHYHLGLFLLKTGRTAAALRSFKNVQKLLAGMTQDHIFEEWDEISVKELAELTSMHMEIAQNS